MRRFVAAVALVIAAVSFTAPPASAGVGYWSYGCRGDTQWFEYPDQTHFRTWYYTHGQPNIWYIQYNLRKMYTWAGRECGGLRYLTGNEFFTRTFRGYRWGWYQPAWNGYLFWDYHDCRHSEIASGDIVWQNFCGV